MTSLALLDIDAPFFRQLMEQVAEGVWVIDARDITRYANPRMAAMLGTTVPQMLGQSMYDFIDPADRAIAQGNLARCREGLHGAHTFLFRRPDGQLVHIEMTAWPIFDRTSDYVGAIAFAIDVTQRVETEAKLAESDPAYQEMFDRSHAIRLMIDPEDGQIVAANATACTYYGYDAATFTTLNIRDIHLFDRDAIQANMALAMRGTHNFFRLRHRLSHGEVRNVEVHTTPIHRNGRVLLHARIHDIGWQTDAERRWRMTQFTIEHASLAVVWLRQDGLIRYANRAAATLAGLDLEVLIGQPVWAIADRLDEASWGAIWTRSVRDGFVFMPAQRWSHRAHAPLLEVEGRTLAFDGENYMILYARDVTHRVRSEQLLKLQHDVLAEIAGASPLPKVLDLLARGVEAISPELLCSVLLLDDTGRLRDAAGPSLPEDYRRAVDGVAIGDHVGSCGTAAYLARPVEVTDIATDPHWADYKDLALSHGLRACWSAPVFSATNQVVATFALYYREPRTPSAFHREIVAAAVRLAGLAIEQCAAEARVHALAFYDPLTGLPNRTLLADRARVALAQAERDSLPLALLFVDLDRFKTINDSLGHAVGDRFLQTMAGRLTAAVRDSDTVCRLGGDEFVLLLPECDVHGALVVAEKLIESVAQPVPLEGMTLNTTVSIGIAMYPEDADDYGNLLKHADTAMYEAKEAGRNGYRFYRREMNEAAAERLEIETALRQALVQGEFELHYQPQIDIATGQIYGAEALLRWRHPERGMVSPARFIPLAEECGLIVEIGAWVLDEACRQMAAWYAAALPLPALSVNLSAVQFRQGDLPSLIERLLAHHQLPSACLRLEITEGLMMGDDGNTIAIIARLEQLGLKLAVDDFGTGYSSLSYLKRFPIAELKLDQSFVRDLGDDPEDRALASAVVSIGHSLKLTVVAEGVETASQLDFLRSKGCHIAQGYFFARPMPAAAFESWLAGRTQRGVPFNLLRASDAPTTPDP